MAQSFEAAATGRLCRLTPGSGPCRAVAGSHMSRRLRAQAAMNATSRSATTVPVLHLVNHRIEPTRRMPGTCAVAQIHSTLASSCLHDVLDSAACSIPYSCSCGNDEDDEHAQRPMGHALGRLSAPAPHLDAGVQMGHRQPARPTWASEPTSSVTIRSAWIRLTTSCSTTLHGFVLLQSGIPGAGTGKAMHDMRAMLVLFGVLLLLRRS